MKLKPIQLDRLEWDWVAQDGVAEKVMEDLADAQQELEILEVALEVVDADLSLKIRSKPRKYGLKSVTEPGIKAAIVLQEEHKRAKFRIIRKKHKRDMMKAQVAKADHRKKALEKLSDLYGQQYWSKPKTSKSNERRMERKRRREDDD